MEYTPGTNIGEKEKQKLLDKAEKFRKSEDKSKEIARAAREAANGTTDAKRRAKLLKKAEKHEIKANAKRVRAKQNTERAAGHINDKEWKRMNNTRRRHRMYDMISGVVTRFRPKNPLREEGMKLSHEGVEFENQGRIFLGGTKAMNRFVDTAGKEWLCKEAVTCVGTAKPMGALVTEAASKLQQRINPETAIRAFAYRDEKGRVCGSLQERMEVDPNAIDLFKWQSDTTQPLPAGMAEQILREHVTDWLLCNFDTKGENFLIGTDGQLRGIDKEQALSYLDDEKTWQMSYTYSPNPNKTLYNTVFEMYANGEMQIDLTAVQPYIERVKSIGDDEYKEMFHDVVEAKCKGDAAKMDKMFERMLERKNGLEAEYGRFFGELNREREHATQLPKVETVDAKEATTADVHGGRTATQPTPAKAPAHRERVDFSAMGIHVGTKSQPKPKAPERKAESREKTTEAKTKEPEHER